LINR